MLATQANDDAIIKLSGTSYARRVADLHRSNPFLRALEDNTPESWYVS